MAMRCSRLYLPTPWRCRLQVNTVNPGKPATGSPARPAPADQRHPAPAPATRTRATASAGCTYTPIMRVPGFDFDQVKDLYLQNQAMCVNIFAFPVSRSLPSHFTLSAWRPPPRPDPRRPLR